MAFVRHDDVLFGSDFACWKTVIASNILLDLKQTSGSCFCGNHSATDMLRTQDAVSKFEVGCLFSAPSATQSKGSLQSDESKKCNAMAIFLLRFCSHHGNYNLPLRLSSGVSEKGTHREPIMTEADDSKPKEKPVPEGYKRRKEVPPVSFLLKHGDPDTAAKPQSWLDVYAMPVFTMVTFILSFFVFKYFIENHTTHRPIRLPRVPKQMKVKTERKMGEIPKRDSEL